MLIKTVVVHKSIINTEMLRALFVVCLATGLSAYHSKGGNSGVNNISEQPPLVQTAQGLIRGNFLNTFTGTRFYSFRGIRYAEPPTGENRFKVKVFMFYLYHIFRYYKNKNNIMDNYYSNTISAIK